MDGAILFGAARRSAARHAAVGRRSSAHGVLPDHGPGARRAGDSDGWRRRCRWSPPFPFAAANRKGWGNQNSGPAARQALQRRPGHGAARARAAGQRRAGKSVDAAHGYSGSVAAAGRDGAPEVDCARDRSRRTRRAAHGALRRVDSATGGCPHSPRSRQRSWRSSRRVAANCRWRSCDGGVCLRRLCRLWCGADWCALASDRRRFGWADSLLRPRQST